MDGSKWVMTEYIFAWLNDTYYRDILQFQDSILSMEWNYFPVMQYINYYLNMSTSRAHISFLYRNVIKNRVELKENHWLFFSLTCKWIEHNSLKG